MRETNKHMYSSLVFQDSIRTAATMEQEMVEAQRQLQERRAQSERQRKPQTSKIVEAGLASVRSSKRSFGI